MRQIRAPSNQERIALLDYLKSAALLPTDVAFAPPASGAPPAGRKPAAGPPTPEPVDRPEADQREAVVTLFKGTCSRCHALPNAARHTAQDWPAVVKRMRGHMRRFGTAEISDEQEREIVSYLQSERRGT
jgi:mono/diheme cytochrome c family protein